MSIEETPKCEGQRPLGALSLLREYGPEIAELFKTGSSPSRAVNHAGRICN
jgi:hypothetical protein